jgi:hypothetical protein
MALTNDPVFAQTPKTSGVEFAASTHSSDMDPSTTTNRIVLVTAGSDGAIVTSLKYFGEVTITAQKICLWLQPLGTGDMFLLDEKLQAAYTMATTTAQDAVVFVDKTDPNTAIRLAGTDKLFISHHVDLQGMGVAEFTNY